MIKINLRKSLFALVLLFGATTAFAQKRTVKGVVTDDSGPLVGVTVVLRDPPPTGTATDLDGSYALDVPDDKAVLVFSFLGYKTVEIEVGTRSVIDVKLVSDALALDEVVVVGYGTQMKSHLTGAISKIGGDVLSDRPVSDITTALQGQISGLNINNVTSEVGVSPSIRVRGTGSISADSAPLVIIDGYPVPDGLSDLNPSDVKSIEVLKDAASAAIYGSRAANGVIMVTTKSGQADKAKYAIKVSQGLKWAYQLHDLMTSNEHLGLLQWQESMGASGSNFVPAANYRAASWIERNIGSTDWQREALRDLAGITNVQFSLTGGKKAFRYYASGAYTKDQGIMLQNEVQKANFRTKMDVDLSPAVKFGVNLSGTYQQASRPKNNFIDFYRTPSFMPVRHNAWTTALTGYEGFARGSHFNAVSVPTGPSEDGGIRWETANPFSSANNNPRSVMANTERWNESFSGLGNIYLTVDIVKGLTIKTSNGFNVKYSPSYYFARRNATKDGEASNATFFSTLYVDLLTENTLDFHRTWGRHDFEALAGYTAETTRVQRVALTGTGFPTDDIRTLNAATIFNLASANNGNGAGTGTFRYPDVVLQSFLARVNYAYDNRYLLSASIRLDSSSLFAGGHRNAWFPSVSLGWRISEEDFMRGLRGVSNLKLRASYGVTGNNNIDYNAALEVYESQNYVLGEGNGSLQPGVAPGAVLANRDITWEQTDEFNFGLDAGFLDNRINLSVDGYFSVTRALLFKQPMQSFSGYTNYWNNIGRVRNAGVEIQLDTYN
ncbi:MAG: SusC/RagA family TonB-linked outer membrane protein, partial [Alistipes sp.]|nr:SusC/RagA family TonB-linked outer membrane protein [Alistipes sp.]